MKLKNHYEKNIETDYLYITKKDLPKIFEVIENKVYLRDSGAKPIQINFPLCLNEEMAKIAAMIMDGCIYKTLYSCMFCQKKDINKVQEFCDILKRTFNLEGHLRILQDTKTHTVTYGTKTLASFLYYCLNIHKSDKEARIPYWIWLSPRSVIIEYLRYAFAMEGSITHFLKGSEIKFHSVDFNYVKDLQKILKDVFKIKSQIQKYYIKDYGWKYYLYFASKEDITKFNEIGFALESHQKRLTELINSFKNKAWEITLVNLLEISGKFTIADANKLFPYLCRRAIHERYKQLVAMGYIQKELTSNNFSLTTVGYNTALKLKENVKTTPLRTYPKINEKAILEFLSQKGKSYRNEVARELKIDTSTVGDTLNRLLKKNKIELLDKDKFQRKFYQLKI